MTDMGPDLTRLKELIRSGKALLARGAALQNDPAGAALIAKALDTAEAAFNRRDWDTAQKALAIAEDLRAKEAHHEITLADLERADAEAVKLSIEFAGPPPSGHGEPRA